MLGGGGGALGDARVAGDRARRDQRGCARSPPVPSTVRLLQAPPVPSRSWSITWCTLPGV